MPKTSAIEPRWVLYKNQLYQVSEFAHLPPKERPRATCPLCEQPVVLKLGKVNAHHYAHAQEADCVAGYPETALHLNTKFHFYNELLQATVKVLRVQQQCDGVGCVKRRRVVWIKDWDAVEVEYRMDPFRPDVALLRQGKVIGAIEILVTHAVDQRKAEFFEEQNTSWSDIRAKESLYHGEKAWRAAKPLPLDANCSEVDDWTCTPCQERRAEFERRREFERLNYTETYRAKMVDYYFPSGKKHREVFFVKRQFKDGECVRAWVETEKWNVVRSVEGVVNNAALRTLAHAVNAEIEAQRAKGTTVDAFMGWRQWVKGSKFSPKDTDRFPFNWAWDGRQKKWLQQEQSELERVSSRSRLTDFRNMFLSHKARELVTPPPSSTEKYVCIFCGQATDDWFCRESDGSCRCNDCLRNGRAKPTRLPKPNS